MPEGDEYVEADATQEAIPMQAVSGVRGGTSYSYPNADPVETHTIYVGQQQNADPNATMNFESEYPSEPPQESVSEKKCALLRFRNDHCTGVCNW